MKSPLITAMAAALMAVQISAAIIILTVSFSVQAKEWKMTKNGEPFVVSTNFKGGPDVQFSAAIFSEWTMSNDGVHQVRAVTFAGRKLDAGADNQVCSITAISGGSRYESVAVSTTARNGNLPTLMVIDSTDSKYRYMSPGATKFIDVLKNSKRFSMVAHCGDKTMVGSYEPDVTYNEMKKAQ